MNTILLSNLIKIRWIAITGQFFAILIVYFLFKINILILESLVVIIFSVVVNLFSYFLQKQDNKISDRLAFLFLFYDTCQLGILLYLTGGVFNPFCILIIAPVIISASYLKIGYSKFEFSYKITKKGRISDVEIISLEGVMNQRDAYRWTTTVTKRIIYLPVEIKGKAYEITNLTNILETRHGPFDGG